MKRIRFRERLSRWIVPTLFGPIVMAAFAVTLDYALATHSGALAFVRWLSLLLVGTVAALLVGVALLLSDAVLLLLRWRTPPTGARAWLSSLAAPAPAYLLWSWFRPPLISSPASHALSIAAAIVVSALVVRLISNPKPGSGRRFS